MKEHQKMINCRLDFLKNNHKMQRGRNGETNAEKTHLKCIWDVMTYKYSFPLEAP